MLVAGGSCDAVLQRLAAHYARRDGSLCAPAGFQQMDGRVIGAASSAAPHNPLRMHSEVSDADLPAGRCAGGVPQGLADRAAQLRRRVPAAAVGPRRGPVPGAALLRDPRLRGAAALQGLLRVAAATCLIETASAMVCRLVRRIADAVSRTCSTCADDQECTPRVAQVIRLQFNLGQAPAAAQQFRQHLRNYKCVIALGRPDRPSPMITLCAPGIWLAPVYQNLMNAHVQASDLAAASGRRSSSCGVAVAPVCRHRHFADPGTMSSVLPCNRALVYAWFT